MSRRDNELVADKPFKQKKEYYKKSHFQLTHNQTNIKLQSLESYQEWGLESIKQRQQEMAKIAVRVWRI